VSTKQKAPTSGWAHGALPANVRIGDGTLITGELAFKRFHSREPNALAIGANCTMDGVHFDLGENGRMAIGNFCYFTNAVLLCELDVRIGNYVVIGWNTTIADTDFHPLAPAERIADAIACCGRECASSATRRKSLARSHDQRSKVRMGLVFRNDSGKRCAG
jgi:acetyltransferase-like isoleucine patch superfamily enzyme